MSFQSDRRTLLKYMTTAVAGLALPAASSGRAEAAVTALKQSIATASARDADLAAFYRDRNYKPIFVGSGDKRRRAALLKAFSQADQHGLPAASYDAAELKALFASARTPDDLGQVEVETAKRFLAYADNLRSGVVNPRRVDDGLVMTVRRFEKQSLLDGFARSNPQGFLKKLPPQTKNYVALQKEKFRLQKLLTKGGWGEKVQAKSLKPGQSGGAVVQLRNRLIRMGYMRNSTSTAYDSKLQTAIGNFQRAHGLFADGVAGPSTIGQVNKQVEERLSQIVVAMERQRWNNQELERKYVWVNIPDFHVHIMQNGKSTFESRVVVGRNSYDRRTPEFSDVMEHMVINPTWYVPRSIITKEYLPMLQENPNSVRQLQITDNLGRVVDRNAVDFTQFDESSFPFSMKEPPNRGNALGLVKFMFPNRHNIYLHDTPAKNLFSREKRDFSHGCIRVHKPFDFAYALLKAQESNPEGFFQTTLNTRRETQVDLREPLPVHIVYYTAWVDSKGRAQYRNDVYGRDGRIFAELKKAGVSLNTVRS
ncbi:MAG: L,D-transpeptidase family protein [Pseudomonadota bacterium]